MRLRVLRVVAYARKMLYTVTEQMRFIRLNHAKKDKKGPQKIDKNRYGRTTVRPDEKKSHKSAIFYGDLRKNANFEKNRKNYDLLGQLSQNIENSMSRFCTLLALCSTNTPVALKISYY